MSDRDEELIARVEALQAERDAYEAAVAEACEMLGHRGSTPTDLADAVGQIERLVEGKDVDCGIEFEGLAKDVEELAAGSLASLPASGMRDNLLSAVAAYRKRPEGWSSAAVVMQTAQGNFAEFYSGEDAKDMIREWGRTVLGS